MLNTLITSRNVLAIAALIGFASVTIGAFAAHGLKHILSHQALLWMDTGVKYQMLHGGVLLILAFALRQWPIWVAVQWACVSFMLGILLFSGSLYIMAASQIKALGMITPIGGIALLVGWLCLLVASFKQPQ
ncbi:MAG: DUF423 domain-containing protein [Gammaproteobacteria bacterium]|nr:DUF423 domain-containing protein [Gammaproteobacteria bacterium]